MTPEFCFSQMYAVGPGIRLILYDRIEKFYF